MAELKRYDCIIIGAGVTGCAAARELSRQNRSIAVLERRSDVCEGTSKANSGIVHAGFDAEPGTWKAGMNMAGNRMMEQLSKELDFPLRVNKTLVLAFEESEKEGLLKLFNRGKRNKVPGLSILDGDEVRELEPAVSDKVCAALYAPTGGIVCPFEMTIAYAENAYRNGVSFFLEHEVVRIMKKGIAGHTYQIETDKETFEAPIVVNAAGVYADVLHNMVSGQKLHITPRRGEYLLFDKSAGTMVSHTIFQLPGPNGKGVLITPTVHGNLLAGPTAMDIEDREGVDTTREGLDEIVEKARRSVPGLPLDRVITSFAGLRAHEAGRDFIIGECPDAEGFFDAAGIASPGLTGAPAIAVYLADLIEKRYPAGRKEGFVPERKGMIHLSELSVPEKLRIIQSNPAYAEVICRCETVTEGEIIDAIQRPLGARTIDGIKRRTRAGMGRCQAGFCAPKIIDILARELNLRPEQVTKCKGDSALLTGRTGEAYEI